MANERRLIDRKATVNTLTQIALQVSDTKTRTVARCISAVELLPTIDAVEVVRCKNCVYFKAQANDWGFGFSVCTKEQMGMLAPCPDDFCSYGERRCE